jgi:O-antigen ligase
MVHSEYGDVAVSTGLVGLAIYMTIFVVFFLRAWKIRRHVPDPVAVRTSGLILAFLVIVLLLDFGRWNFSEKDSWIVFGSLIGYSNAVWQQWKAYQAGAMQVVPAAPAATRLGPVVPGRAV